MNIVSYVIELKTLFKRDLIFAVHYQGKGTIFRNIQNLIDEIIMP